MSGESQVLRSGERVGFTVNAPVGELETDTELVQ